MINDQNDALVNRIRARPPDRGIPSAFPAQSGRRAVQNLQMGWAFSMVAGVVNRNDVGVLEAAGHPATVRRERGAEIDGACGQLRRRHEEGQPVESGKGGGQPS